MFACENDVVLQFLFLLIFTRFPPAIVQGCLTVFLLSFQTSNSVKVYLADWTTTPSPRRGLSRPVTPTLTLTPTHMATTRTTNITRTLTTRTTNTTPTPTPRTSTTTTRATIYTSTTTTESNRTTRATGPIPTATGVIATPTATRRTT